jgi:hypothetical protein
MLSEFSSYYRFICDDCGAAIQFPRTDCSGARGEYWDFADQLKGMGWRCSARYGELCLDCKRKADTGLLDRPVKRIARG